MRRREKKRSCRLCGERVTIKRRTVVTTATGALHVDECSHFDPVSRTELVTPESIAAREREIAAAKVASIRSSMPSAAAPSPSTHKPCTKCGFVEARCRCE